jgi:hypothetical protein
VKFCERSPPAQIISDLQRGVLSAVFAFPLIASTTIAQTPAPTPKWVTTSVPTLLGFAVSAMTTSAGAAYILPAGYGLSLTGFYDTNIAVGGFVPPTSPAAVLNDCIPVSVFRRPW